MTPRTTRSTAAILVVVLALLVIWSFYNLDADARASGIAPSKAVASYLAEGNGAFVAALAPNDLCNCTQVSGGNATLFPSITQTITTTLGTTLYLDVPATITTLDHFIVTLSSTAWSKTVYSSPVNQTTVTAKGSVSTQNQYTFNVSETESLISSIENTTRFPVNPVWLTLSASVVETVAVGAASGTLSISSVGNFTFFPLSITTAFHHPTTTGTIDAPPGTDEAIPLSAFAFVAISGLALVCAVTWYLRASTRSRNAGGEPAADLEELIAPFEEVIAETATVPDPAATVMIDRWEGLVKISDTLGKPILRPAAAKPSQPRTSFYVLDGDIGYLYRYRRNASDAGPPRSSIADLPGAPGTTLRRVRAVAGRIEALQPDDARFPRALARFRRVRALVQAHRWVEAESALAELELMLGSAEGAGSDAPTGPDSASDGPAASRGQVRR